MPIIKVVLPHQGSRETKIIMQLITRRCWSYFLVFWIL